ncbi:MAG: glycosyltransferase family 4 protein [Polyangiaceae bacterium]
MTVRYVGFLAEQSGYGEAARRHLLALARSGVPVRGSSVTLNDDGSPRECLPSTAHREVRRLTFRKGAYDTVVVHTPPPQFTALRDAAKKNIGVAAWETRDVPAGWSAELERMDEIWVPSRFCQKAFQRGTKRPVHVVPHPVDTRPPGPRGLPEIPPDVFLFVSIMEWSDRKNPDGLLRAFLEAFRGRRDVALLIKAGLRFVPDPERIVRYVRRLAGKRGPTIYLNFDDLSDGALVRLLRRADAYVSLHRAEGFGLTLAEAMACGVPVVATAYSGNLDFMDRESAFLVECRMVPVRQTWTRIAWFDRGAEWAEPSLDAAVSALRECFDSPSRRGQIAESGQRRVASQLSSEAIGARMRALLRA